MEVSLKKQTAFRLDSKLLEKLKAAAQREHRSLNNFVECLLMDCMYNQPNEETKAAIDEARSGKSAGQLNMSNFESFMKSVENIE